MHDEPTLGSQVRPDPPALDLSWSRSPIVPSSGLSRMQPADASTGRGSAGLPSAPFGRSRADPSLTMLVLLAALATSVRAFRPPVLRSIVPRAVATKGTALALSVEPPG